MKTIQNAIRPLALAGLVAVLFFTSVANANKIGRRWDPHNITNSPAQEWQDRLAPLIRDLPEQGRIGYISERDIPGQEYDIVDTNYEMALTQYAIIPRILVLGPEVEYIIANCAMLPCQEKFEDLFGIHRVQSYPNGIYLFKGPGQR